MDRGFPGSFRASYPTCQFGLVRLTAKSESQMLLAGGFAVSKLSLAIAAILGETGLRCLTNLPAISSVDVRLLAVDSRTGQTNFQSQGKRVTKSVWIFAWARKRQLGQRFASGPPEMTVS